MITSFGERVREARTAKNLSQPALAKLIDIERLQVLRWEKGEAFPRASTLEKLAAVTERPLAWFFENPRDPVSLAESAETLADVGERIRAARSWLGLSQEAMSKLFELDALQISRWERNESFPRLAHLEQLAQMIGRPVAWFFLKPGTAPLPPGPPPAAAPRRIADDRPPVVQLELIDVGAMLVEGLREQLNDPLWEMEGEAAHQGELLSRARTRLGLNQELMAERVLGWSKKCLSRVEKGDPITAQELAEYLSAMGITLNPLSWNAPTEIRGLATEFVHDAEGNVTVEKVRYPTKVELQRWCPSCELYRLLYPNFCCPQHRGTDWELDEAMRAVERARKQLQRAERQLAQVLKRRGHQV